MVLNNLIDFCFNRGVNNVLRLPVSSYSVYFVKDIKYNHYVLKKQQITDAAVYLLVILPLLLISSARLLVFLCGLIQLFFLQVYSYIFMKVSG